MHPAFILLILFTVRLASAQDIVIRSFWSAWPIHRYDEPLTAPTRTDVFLQIKNAGTSPATVLCPKKNLLYIKAPKNPAVALTYQVRFSFGIAGVSEVVPSMQEVSPVYLEPGEITEVRLPVTLDSGIVPEKALFYYSVQEKLARRFSAWFGYLTTPIAGQRMGNAGVPIPWSAQRPNKAPEPTTTSVTPPAAQEARQP